MSATRHHRNALTALGITAVLAVAACTSEPAPLPTTATTWPAQPDGTPAVVWPHGEPDDGKWAEDPWVEAVRTFDRAYTGAFYLNDFTLTRFHGTGIDYDIDGLAAGRGHDAAGSWNAPLAHNDQAGLSAPGPLYYHPGPKPFYVLDVETYKTDSGQERATVYGCGIDGWWVTDPQDVPSDPTQQDPKIWEYRVRRVNDTQFQVSSASPVILVDGKTAAELCDTSRVRLGFFDPASPYGQPVLPWEVLDINSQPIEDFDPEIAAHATPRPAPPPVPTGDDG